VISCIGAGLDDVTVSHRDPVNTRGRFMEGIPTVGEGWLADQP